MDVCPGVKVEFLECSYCVVMLKITFNLLFIFIRKHLTTEIQKCKLWSWRQLYLLSQEQTKGKSWIYCTKWVHNCACWRWESFSYHVKYYVHGLTTLIIIITIYPNMTGTLAAQFFSCYSVDNVVWQLAVIGHLYFLCNFTLYNLKLIFTFAN